MKKKMVLLIAVTVIISIATGCGSGKGDSSIASVPANNSESVDTESSVDMKKLEEAMTIADAILKSVFGSDYSLVYDQGGVIISFQKENAANAVARVKNGDRQAVDFWEQMLEAMQSVSTKLQEILEQYGISGIPVTVQCFDKQDKDTALGIVVDGKVTYDASK